METERECGRREIRRRSWLGHLWHEWIVESRRSIAPAFAHPTPESWSNDDLTVAWIGHSTVLINFFGIKILTDPVLFPRIGIRLAFLTVGPKRLTQPALTFAELPPIDLVLLSHAHFDHMGNINAFPNATFYIQERELSKWVWTMSLERRFRWLMLGIDPADIMRLVDLARQGRLVAVDGDRENVVPGIDLHAAFDSHTWGSQYVTVRNDLSPGSAESRTPPGMSVPRARGVSRPAPALPGGLGGGFGGR